MNQNLYYKTKVFLSFFKDCLRALKTEIGFLLGQTVAMKGINKLELQAPKDI